MMVTVEEAKELLCPIMAPVINNYACHGPKCMMWRWKDHAADPNWVAAVRQAAKDIGDVSPNRTIAARHVMNNREKYGLPVMPERGWCGLAGKPEWWPQ